MINIRIIHIYLGFCLSSDVF